jgi:acetyl-CoA synthetase
MTIEARLSEQEYFSPPQSFIEQANCNDPEVYDRFDRFPEGFTEYAEMLDWYSQWDQVLDQSNPPFYKWFVGGTLNASYNCVDRHLDAYADKTALLWEGEDGDVRRIAYQDLYREVNETAAFLRDVGVGEGDILTIHMPMVPELPVTMLAAARIGAPHSVVFAGFSADALAHRLDDAGSQHLVTIDGYYRRGEFLNHKAKADQAVEQATVDVENVLVYQRHETLDDGCEIVPDRDVIVDEEIEQYHGRRVEPVERNAEDPLFIMYTSGTTGSPKAPQHRTGGYLSYVAGTSKYLFDIHPEDTYWCMADIGWITGHSYIVYGPLSIAATSVMYEGAPDYPDKGVTWRIAEDYDVDIFHTSPTAVRMFMKWGEEWPNKYDFDFKHMTSVGEPIQPEAWLWYYKHIGRENAVVVDTWWQTETGGVLLSNLPALQDMKPGSVGKPMPGIKADILDDDGEQIESGSGKAGNLVIERPWPGMLQTLYEDDERFIKEYWEEFSDTDSDDPADWTYYPADGAVQSEDGYYRILGRLDDVMNVAGHRLGTMELESAVAEVPAVSESAVVSKDHPEKGEVPEVYATLRESAEAEPEQLRLKIKEAVEEEIGPFARPAGIYVVTELPKTRSGKIMRRLLSRISNNEELGDTTTLRDPDVPERIREQVQTDQDA